MPNITLFICLLYKLHRSGIILLSNSLWFFFLFFLFLLNSVFFIVIEGRSANLINSIHVQYPTVVSTTFYLFPYQWKFALFQVLALPNDAAVNTLVIFSRAKKKKKNQPGIELLGHMVFISLDLLNLDLLMQN